MTSRDSTTLPTKDVRYCPTTRDYEVTVNGRIIGYAPTMLRGYELANEYTYQHLTRDHLDPADLPQDDAEALLLLSMAEQDTGDDVNDIFAEKDDSAEQVAQWAASRINQFMLGLTEADHADFWSQVRRTENCWIWTGSMSAQWYGSYRGHGAHRVAYLLTYGPIPPGMMICHHCDHPPCVRPDHLFLGTAKDNAQDFSIKGRKKPRGLQRDTLFWRFQNQVAKKAWQQQRRLHYRYIAAETGLDRYIIYGIAGGFLTEISPEALTVLCTYFDCTEEDLLGPKKE